MNQNRDNTQVNATSNTRSLQSGLYDMLLMTIEMDLENIRISSGAGAIIELISPSLISIINKSSEIA